MENFNFNISQRDILNFIVISLLCILTYFLVMRLLNRFLSHTKIDENFHSFIKSICKITLLILLSFVILSSVFNVNISTFLTVFGVAGLAVSLAIKDSLANVASGFLLLICKPFEKGNFVEINNVSGTVLDVSLIYTTISTIDNKVIYIPNGEVSKDVVVNYNTQSHRRLDITFNIEYSENIDKVKKVIYDCVTNSEYYDDSVAPVKIVVSNLSSSSVDILCISWCLSDYYLDYMYELNETVKKEFDKNNIVIPFQQLDVTIKK